MQHVTEFLTLLTGERDPIVTWQVFYDVKDGSNRPDLAKTFSCTHTDAAEYLAYAQSQHCGVYVCINETDRLGRETKNITKLRVLFADYDGIFEPLWPITPSFKTMRDATHGHAFWLINPDEWIADEWTSMQRRISQKCNTDPQVIDPARVVRVPSYLHLKNPHKPCSYSIVAGASRRIYTKAEMQHGFVLDAEGETKLQAWIDSRNGLCTGQGYTNSTIYIEKSITWLKERAHPAVLGDGTATLIRSISYLHDHGISLDRAKELAWEYYNPRCEPPWSDGERHHFDSVIERAYRYATSEAGCKTAVAEFGRLPALPAPIDGWDKNKKVNDDPIIEVVSEPHDDRITSGEATILQPQLNAKSGHYDLARAFDGAVFDGVKLKRCDKIFYRYNGTCWGMVSDEVIKSLIQRYYAYYKPSNSFTRGVYDCLVDLVNVPEFINKTWIGKEITDPQSTVVFKNCIVDFSGETPKRYAHTPSFINFNALPINYDPSAKCPRFHQFLSEIWGDDQTMKWQLIEWMGYLLIAGNHMQKMAIMMGVRRGGKSLIAKLCCALVGSENTTSTDLNDIYKDSTLQAMHMSSLTYMPDQHDVSFQNRSRALSTLKAVTGGDPIGWHLIYKGRQSSVINSKLMMTTNNLPSFNDASGAVVNRMLIFPFDRTFDGQEDFELEGKLMNELQGITNLALEGLERLRRNGRFTEPTRSAEEKEEVRNSMFSLSEFIESHCTLESDAISKVDDVYHVYKVWATASGVKLPFDKARMVSELRNSPHGITKTRLRLGKDGERHYVLRGIKVNTKLKFDNVAAIK